MISRILTKTGAILDIFLRSLFALAGIIIIFDMVLVCVDVVVRYSPITPLLFVVEITEYSLLFIVFLGTAWVLKRNEHVAIDLLPNQLSPETRALLETILSALGMLVFLTIAYYAGQSAWEAHISGDRIYTLLEPPKSPFMFTISAGSFLLSVEFLRKAYSYFMKWRAY